MASRRTLICDTCGKKEKKNKTGWLGTSVSVKLYGKKWLWWHKKDGIRDIYIDKHFCSLPCFNIWFDSLVVTGELSRKAKKLLKKLRKSK